MILISELILDIINNLARINQDRSRANNLTLSLELSQRSRERKIKS